MRASTPSPARGALDRREGRPQAHWARRRASPSCIARPEPTGEGRRGQTMARPAGKVGVGEAATARSRSLAAARGGGWLAWAAGRRGGPLGGT